MFYNQGEEAEQAHAQAGGAAVGEANRKPGQTGMFMQASDLEKQLKGRNRVALTIILVLIFGTALAIAGGVYGPAILGPPGADRQAQNDRDAALVLVAKDDVADLQAADKALGDILARKPLYVAAKADRAMVQQFLADDRLWQTERLKASYDARGKQVRQLTTRNDPNDAPQRAKVVEAMNGINKQYERPSASRPSPSRIRPRPGSTRRTRPIPRTRTCCGRAPFSPPITIRPTPPRSSPSSTCTRSARLATAGPSWRWSRAT